MPGALSGGERPLLFSVLHQNSVLLFCTQALQEEERHLFHLVTIGTFLLHRVGSYKKLNPGPESRKGEDQMLHTRVLLIWWLEEPVLMIRTTAFPCVSRTKSGTEIHKFI